MLVVLGVWGVRVAIARITEASDLKMSKVCYGSERTRAVCVHRVDFSVQALVQETNAKTLPGWGDGGA